MAAPTRDTNSPKQNTRKARGALPELLDRLSHMATGKQVQITKQGVDEGRQSTLSNERQRITSDSDACSVQAVRAERKPDGDKRRPDCGSVLLTSAHSPWPTVSTSRPDFQGSSMTLPMQVPGAGGFVLRQGRIFSEQAACPCTHRRWGTACVGVEDEQCKPWRFGNNLPGLAERRLFRGGGPQG